MFKKIITKFLILFLVNTILFNNCFTNTNQEKPFSATILIDIDNEIDPSTNSAASSNLSILFYLQASPIIIFGEHLLVNLIQKTNFIKSDHPTSIKYFVLIQNALKDFDKNWITIQISKNYKNNNIYILIPKKYIEYFFNLDSIDIKACLSSELQKICNQKKIINNNGYPCTSIEDIFGSCGFNFYKGPKYKIMTYNDLLNIKLGAKKTDYDDFNLNIEKGLSNLLSEASTNKKWYLFINGHGCTKSDGYYGSICGISDKYFNKIFKNMCLKNIAWFCLNSCNLGGPNRKIIEKIIKQLPVKQRPCIAIQSPTDSPSYSFGVGEIDSKELSAYLNKLNLIIFEPQNSVTTFGLYKRCILDSSFFRGEDIENSFIAGAMKQIDSINEEKLMVSNWPLILNPNKSLKFVPLEHEKYIFIITKQTEKTNSIIQTNGHQIVFLDTEVIKNINFFKKIPFIFSTSTEPCIHLIEKINIIDLDTDITTFLKQILLDSFVQLKISKEFLIKELIINNDHEKKYLNIYANQFYDEKFNNFIVDIIWQDTKNITYYTQYTYNKDKSDQNWHQNHILQLPLAQIIEFKNKVSQTEQYVRNKAKC